LGRGHFGEPDFGAQSCLTQALDGPVELGGGVAGEGSSTHVSRLGGCTAAGPPDAPNTGVR